MLQLFQGLRAQLGRALLFLKSVRACALYVKDGGAYAPRLLCRASLNPQGPSQATTPPRSVHAAIIQLLRRHRFRHRGCSSAVPAQDSWIVGFETLLAGVWGTCHT